METPKNTRNRSTHTPTPKMSDRKKNLFSASKQPPRLPIPESVEMDIMDGLMPLDFESAIMVQSRLKSSLRPRVKKFPENISDILKKTDRVPLSLLGNSNMDVNHSPRTRTKTSAAQRSTTKEESKKSPGSCQTKHHHKTPSPRSRKHSCPDELGTLFKDTLHLRSTRTSRYDAMDSSDCVSDDETPLRSNSNKRCPEKTNQSPKAKHPKLDSVSMPSSPLNANKSDPNSNTESPSNNKNLITSIDQFSIPTKTFYSSQSSSAPVTPKSTNKPRISILSKSQSSKRSSNLPTASSGGAGGGSRKAKQKSRHDLRLGRNISHKVPRPKFKPTPQTIDSILQSLNGEKFKKLLENRMYKKKAEEVHKIMKRNPNPIERSRPLNVTTVPENAAVETFSDSDDDDEESRIDIADQLDNESVISEVRIKEEDQLPAKPRKFFKSKGTIVRNAFTINNVRGTVKDGRISFLPAPKVRRRKSTGSARKPDFAMEQAAVSSIIDMLGGESTTVNTAPTPLSETACQPETLAVSPTDTDVEHDEYSEFRKRIPYNTSDPEVIEQQQLLLDFLISYQICNDRNFEIFIADPDNHKEEAAKVVDSCITIEPIPNRETIVEQNGCDDEGPSEVSEKMDLNLTDSQESESFRQRLPYKTTDPVVAEQQKTLLEFLIKNQICTEENFQIFIADPDKHRDKASKILQNYMIPNASMEGQTDQQVALQNYLDNCMIIDPFSEDAEIPSTYVAATTFETSHTTLESMMSDDDDNNSQWRELSPVIPLQDSIENAENRSNNQNDCNLYPIFYMGNKIRPIENQSKRKPPKTFVGGFGASQYQIDAGQKEFGAKQCPKCGLVYTAHEPEEEQLHAIYHRSLSVLKFKGWIDEDVVEFLPEWGSGGRIIRLTHNIHPKRMERIIDVLNIIDKELGIVSDRVPTPFVSYLAIKRNEIVGFCLIQPIKSANRYICMNGVDCCTEEMFDVKCGISRIWVSPLNRGCRIATKLIDSIRRFTIPGMELTVDDIAFSSPTQDGKLFAQCVTKRKDFLIYQSF